MNSSKNDCYINNMQSIPACEPTGHNHDPIVRETGQSTMFSHIYVEAAVRNHPRTQRILQQFLKAQVISITHYKDVFCRKGQQVHLQHGSKALIIARKDGQLLYEGAEVCQSFGNEYFYYTSCVMNCIYDCEYCYLKGMYPSGNLVIFINIEDIFAELETLLAKHPVYLCVSYDTDLLALEDIAGFVKKWAEFTVEHPKLRIEIRTKCARTDLWKELPVCDRVIYAFTLSPEEITVCYEHGTPTLAARVASVKLAGKMGHPVRLCFDPMIYYPHYKEVYRRMLGKVFAQIDTEHIVDVSMGSFRISKDYLKNMRRHDVLSPVVQFPYENIDGVYQYPDKLRQEMEGFLHKELCKYVEEEHIFCWDQI